MNQNTDTLVSVFIISSKILLDSKILSKKEIYFYLHVVLIQLFYITSKTSHPHEQMLLLFFSIPMYLTFLCNNRAPKILSLYYGFALIDIFVLYYFATKDKYERKQIIQLYNKIGFVIFISWFLSGLKFKTHYNIAVIVTSFYLDYILKDHSFSFILMRVPMSIFCNFLI